jgi:3-oxoadipate enol-lactonase
MTGPVDRERDGFAWREAGEGELVVLLHGLGGSRVSWDLPGYGASTPLPNERVTFRALANAAAGFVHGLGEHRAHVVGISMGGMIAQYLAAWHPEVVRSLTLLSTSPAFGLDGTRPDEWRAARLAPLDQGLEPVDFADRVLSAIAGPNITAEALAGQRAAMARITSEALRRSIDCLITHDTRPLLADIHAHTLVMVGALDEETPEAYSEHLARHIPVATLAVISGAGHLLNVEAPDEVNRLIARHLDIAEDA